MAHTLRGCRLPRFRDVGSSIRCEVVEVGATPEAGRTWSRTSRTTGLWEWGRDLGRPIVRSTVRRSSSSRPVSLGLGSAPHGHCFNALVTGLAGRASGRVDGCGGGAHLPPLPLFYCGHSSTLPTHCPGSVWA